MKIILSERRKEVIYGMRTKKVNQFYMFRKIVRLKICV